MKRLGPLESVVKESIEDFFNAVVRDEWRGREREVVSLYAFEFLASRAGGSGLRSSAQIGIECAVPQVLADGKKQVCKDLVIWPDPRMTVWDEDGRPTRTPSLIVEWKVAGYPGRSPKSMDQMIAHDVVWLEAFTERYPGTRGIAVGLHWTARPQLRASRVIEGRAGDDWWIAIG